jgi:hypothetical protein
MKDETFYLMRLNLIIILVCLSTVQSKSQHEIPTNSLEKIYKQRNASINYNYDNATQTHDYSGNWDFDSDGMNDGLLFIGSGGAHLYFSLKIILTSQKTAVAYPYIELDTPLLADNEVLKTVNYNPLTTYNQFAVYDFDKDGTSDIFIHLDQPTKNSKELQSQGITSENILLTYNNGKFKIRNY